MFVEIRPDTLNLDETRIEAAITSRTHAIVPVHYAGVGCHMGPIQEIARRHGLMVIEDAAQGVNAHYRGRALGSIGQLGTYSFHETKNLACGEGGALCINDTALIERAEVLREKGTDRSKFLRGEIDKYTWIEAGCSGVPSELACAFLLAQLERMDGISDAPLRDPPSLPRRAGAPGTCRLVATPASPRGLPEQRSYLLYSSERPGDPRCPDGVSRVSGGLGGLPLRSLAHRADGAGGSATLGATFR